MSYSHKRSTRVLASLAALTLTLAYRASAQEADSASTAVLKKLSVEQLMDLEVTSVSKRPEKLSQTASAIQVITAEDIRRSGVTSLPEALRLASNLQVAQIDSRQWAITARGFNNSITNKLLVLIDGRTVYTPLYAGVFWDVQDTMLEDVERIEVISGPGATQWGANAVNGVINIITRNARDTQGVLLSTSGGTALRDSIGARYGGALSSDIQYRLYGKYFDRASSVLADGRQANDDWHMGQGGFRLDWTKGTRDNLTVQGDFYGGAMDQGAPAASGADIDVNGRNLLTRWSRTFSERSDLQLQIYYDHTYRRIPNSIEQSLDTYDIDFQHRFVLASVHDIIWGLTYRLVDDEIGNPPTLAFLPSKVTQRWYGGFVQDEITLVPDRLQLMLGTKLDHNDYTGVEVQPSIRMIWLPSPTQTLWSAISRAVRTPSRIDRDFYAPRDPPFTVLQGGPNFSSEKVLSYELGFRVRPSRSLALSLATFYNDYDDLRSVEPVNPPAPFPITLANGLRGKSYGAEWTAEYTVSEMWRLRAGYTELRSHSEPKPGSLDRVSSRSVALDPHRQAQLRSLLDLSSSVQCDATLRYVASIPSQSVPAYTELDLRLSWKPRPSWELSLVAQNLLHDHHAEFGALSARREIERSVYGKIAWGF